MQKRTVCYLFTIRFLFQVHADDRCSLSGITLVISSAWVECGG